MWLCNKYRVREILLISFETVFSWCDLSLKVKKTKRFIWVLFGNLWWGFYILDLVERMRRTLGHPSSWTSGKIRTDLDHRNSIVGYFNYSKYGSLICSMLFFTTGFKKKFIFFKNFELGAHFALLTIKVNGPMGQKYNMNA